MRCPNCGKDGMTEDAHRKWSPSVLYICMYLLIAVIFFALYGVFSKKYGSENVMPIFMGLTPLVVAPFVIELRRRKIISGWRCPHCDTFTAKTGEAPKPAEALPNSTRSKSKK